MSKTKVKICGIRRLEDSAILNETLPDFAGFVFAKSPRRITFQEADILRRHLDRRIQTVGVFVNEPVESILQLVNEQVIDLIQLHGDEDDQYLKELAQQTDAKIIKAVRVSSESNLNRSYAADYLLYDAYHGNKMGGTGKTFNWEMLRDKKEDYFLAGGLNPQNIKQAIQQLHPYAVDISSGVETDGYKDRNKIIQLLSNIQEVTA